MEIGAIIVTIILSAIMTLVVQWLWQDILPSIILRFQKNEPTIQGYWKTKFSEEGKDFDEDVEVTQKGRKVIATIILNYNNEKIIYHFIGIFKHRILSGTYDSIDETDFERGAILLQYKRKGKFVGQYSFFSKTSDQIVSSNYEWNYVKK